MMSAMGPTLQPYLWWKKYLTQLQLVRFIIPPLCFMFVSMPENIKLPFKLWHLLSGCGSQNYAATNIVNKLPTFYGSCRFLTIFVQACFLSLSWAKWIQSTSLHPVYLRHSLVLSYHLHLGLSSRLFPSGLPTQTQHAFLFSSIHVTCLICIILLNWTTLIIFGEGYKLWSFSLCSFIQPPIASPLLGRSGFQNCILRKKCYILVMKKIAYCKCVSSTLNGSTCYNLFPFHVIKVKIL